MSHLPQTQLLNRVSQRRKLLAFCTVGCTVFVLLSMLWPLSTRAYQSQSEIEFSIAKRQNATEDFESLLKTIVTRHTSSESIANLIQQNGLGGAPTVNQIKLAERVRDQLNITIDRDRHSADALKIRVSLRGAATPRENYFVNALATTLAKDFMVSPLASIVPQHELDAGEILSLDQRREMLYDRANDLLAQIEGNLNDAAEQLPAYPETDQEEYNASFAAMQRDSLDAELRDLVDQRGQATMLSGERSAAVAALDARISEKQNELSSLDVGSDQPELSSPFMKASFTLNRNTNAVAELKSNTETLRRAVSQLTDVAARATAAAKSAGSGPAFSIEGVRGKVPAPVDGVPGKREMLLLMLASTLIAGIVSLTYKPFANCGFESLEQIEKRLGLNIVATLDNRHHYEEATGPGIATEVIEHRVPRSNRIVAACQWLAFCGVMLTIGFCLVNAGVREAFLENPFYGLARIIWTLKGNA